jgi:small subunit ribosomal protein S1
MADPGDFASMFESSRATGGRKTAHLSAGELVEGTVLAISSGLVILDIGSSADATLDLTELNDREIKVGDRLRATVQNPRSDGPVLTLALGRGGAAVGLAELERAKEGGTPVSGTVTASNKGGFTVEIAGVRAFCPISQIDLAFVNDPEIYVGQTFEFQVTEIREGGRNVVVSRKRLLQDARRQNEEQVAKTISPGSVIEGTVKGTVKHGAIIELGGVEGFIPMSELARTRIERAEDVVTIGETVKVQVLSVERGERGLSIRLSLKALEAPVNTPEPQKDEILRGKVIKHVPNGLIISTTKGEGLVPTRELSLAPGADHRRAYAVDSELDVVVVSRDPNNGKLRFSVEKVAQVEERNNYRQFHGDDSKGSSMGSLGDLMSKKFPGLSASTKGRAGAPEQTPPAASSTKTPGSGSSGSPGRTDGVRRRENK